MTNLRKVLKQLFKLTPLLIITLIVTLFFWQYFLQKKIPIPGDFVIGTYYPWLDYKWGYEVGVPVKNPILTDIVSFIYPMQALSVKLLKGMSIPYWNPYILAGTPLLANFQSAPFSPTNIVFFIFNQLDAWSIQIVLQHLLIALFTYVLLRSWKVSKLPAIFGGIIFAFSGYNVIWSGWNGHALASAFFPLTIYLVDKYFDKNNFLIGLGISISVMFIFFSGYPQSIIYLLLTVFTLLAVKIYKSGKKLTVNLKTLLTLGLFFVFGLLLSLPQILPGMELLSLSQRQIEPHPYAWAFLPLSKIITFVAPDYYGNHATANYWGPQDYTSNTGYVGIVALVFSLLALQRIKTEKRILFAFSLFIIGMIFSLATPISVFLWKSGFLGLNAASAHRALVLCNFSIALLAAFGLDDYLKQKVKKVSLAVIIPGIILLIFILNSLFIYFSKGNLRLNDIGLDTFIISIRNLVLPVGILILSILIFFIKKIPDVLKIIIFMSLCIFELFRFGWKYTAFTPKDLVFPNTPIIDFLVSQQKPFRVSGAEVIPVNIRMNYGLESLEGYDAMYPVKISKFISSLNSGKYVDLALGRYAIVNNVNSRLLDLINTRYLLTIKKDKEGKPDSNGAITDKFIDARYKTVFCEKTVCVIEAKQALSRATMFYNWVIVDNEDEALKRLFDENLNIFKTLVLVGDPGIPKTNINIGNTVKYLKYSENESAIEVVTESPGILFVSDAFYPGWKAYLDGNVVDIIMADYNFRGVVVPSGKHIVSFKFEPRYVNYLFNYLKVNNEKNN